MVSRTRTVICPDSIPATIDRSPLISIASCRQSSSVCRTSTWSGISIGPGATFS